jgi:hypothetical protein
MIRPATRVPIDRRAGCVLNKCRSAFDAVEFDVERRGMRERVDLVESFRGALLVRVIRTDDRDSVVSITSFGVRELDDLIEALSRMRSKAGELERAAAAAIAAVVADTRENDGERVARDEKELQ